MLLSVRAKDNLPAVGFPRRRECQRLSALTGAYNRIVELVERLSKLGSADMRRFMLFECKRLRVKSGRGY
jgi:hypothetical protein